MESDLGEKESESETGRYLCCDCTRSCRYKRGQSRIHDKTGRVRLKSRGSNANHHQNKTIERTEE